MVARGFTPGGKPHALNSAWRTAIWGLRVLAGLVFIYAGWLKTQAPQDFADSVAAFQLLPTRLNNLLALGLPPFELAVGSLLLTGWKTRVAAFCGLASCGIFLLALVSAIIRGLPVECGCFGNGPSSIIPALRLPLAIGRDILLGGGVALVYFDARRKS